MNKYTIYEDKGHAWMKVSSKEIIKLGIAEKISEFSFISKSGKWIYLEEDCDLDVFCKAKLKLSEEYVVEHDYAHNNSRIRNYRSYSVNKLFE